MTGYSVPDVQRAVLARLKSDAGVSALVAARVYDTAPTDAKLPCVAINQIDMTPDNTADTDGATVNIALSVFTVGARARVEAHDISARIIDALNDRVAPLALAHGTAWQCRLLSAVVFRTEDQRGGAHGVIRFEVRTQS